MFLYSFFKEGGGLDVYLVLIFHFNTFAKNQFCGLRKFQRNKFYGKWQIRRFAFADFCIHDIVIAAILNHKLHIVSQDP